MRRLVLFVLLGGCHKLFGLDHVDLDRPRDGGDNTDGKQADAAVDDAAIDAATIDAAATNCPISPVVFDEDGDSIDDRCDACPTIPSDGLDGDGDGLPNACDPGLAPMDKILFAATFAEASDLTAFDGTGVTWSPAAQGTVSFAQAAMLRTVMLYPATMIEVRTTGVSSAATAGEFIVATTSATCRLRTSNCAKTSTASMCAQLDTTTSVAEIGASAATLRKMWLRRTSTPSTFCTIENVSNARVESVGNVALGDAQIQLTTNSMATAVVQSVVIYGAQ